MAEWAALIAERTMSASTPREAVAEAVQRWWREREAIGRDLGAVGCPLDHSDLIRVLDELLRLLLTTPLPDEYAVAMGDVRTNPRYAIEFTPEAVNEHLGLAAERKRLLTGPVPVLTQLEHWSVAAAHILVEADLLREQGPGSIREHLELLESPPGLLKLLADDPCALMENLPLGVRALWEGTYGEDPTQLNFTLGPRMYESIEHMGYRRNRRYATQLLRAMMLVATGQPAAIKAHAHRLGPGGNNPPVRDGSGRVLQRGALARNSPNAHRLFWWNGATPEFVCATGHDDDPLL